MILAQIIAIYAKEFIIAFIISVILRLVLVKLFGWECSFKGFVVSGLFGATVFCILFTLIMAEVI